MNEFCPTQKDSICVLHEIQISKKAARHRKGAGRLNKSIELQLRASCYECLAGLVGLVLLEVLDEAACQILSLGLPLSCVSISVARVKDCGINAGKLCGNLEVEVRDLLGGSLQNVAIEDPVFTR